MTTQPDTIHAALGIGEQTQCCLNCRYYDQYYVRDHTRAAYFWPMNAGNCTYPTFKPRRPTATCPNFKPKRK